MLSTTMSFYRAFQDSYARVVEPGANAAFDYLHVEIADSCRCPKP